MEYISYDLEINYKFTKLIMVIGVEVLYIISMAKD